MYVFNTFEELSMRKFKFGNYNDSLIDVFANSLYKRGLFAVMGADSVCKEKRGEEPESEPNASQLDKNDRRAIAAAKTAARMESEGYESVKSVMSVKSVKPVKPVIPVPTQNIFIECKCGPEQGYCDMCGSNRAEYLGYCKYSPYAWTDMLAKHSIYLKQLEKPVSVQVDEDEDIEEEDDADEGEDIDEDEDEDIDEDPGMSGMPGPSVPVKKPKKLELFCTTVNKIVKKQFKVVAAEKQSIIGRAALKQIIFDIIRKEIAPLAKRIDEMEHTVYPKGIKVVFKKGNGGGKCKKCNQTHTKNGKPLKPGKFPLDILRMPISNGTSKDARDMPAKEFGNLVVKHNKYCTECAECIETNYLLFDMNNRQHMCLICRTARAKNATVCCADCDIVKLQTDHAKYKGPLHRAFAFLNRTVTEIESVETSVDADPYKKINGEFEAKGYGFIDFAFEIKTKNGKKHFFAVEVMATKVEKVPLMAHKFAKARELTKADKSYIVLLDIKHGNDEYTLEQKIDIFRRWVIFAIKYAAHLPSINNWWFFPKRNAYPLRGQDGYADRINPFYSNPVKILGPPKSIKEGADWEFASDVFAVGTDIPNDPFGFIYNPNKPPVNINEFMFGGIDGGDGIINDLSKYALYNIDSETDMGKALSCTIEGCKVCKEFYKSE